MPEELNLQASSENRRVPYQFIHAALIYLRQILCCTVLKLDKDGNSIHVLYGVLEIF